MTGSAARRQAHRARVGCGGWRRAAVLALGVSVLAASSSSAELPAATPDTLGDDVGTVAGTAAPLAAPADTFPAPAVATPSLVPIDLGLLGGARPRQLDGRALSLTYPNFAGSYRHSMWREVQGSRFESGLVWADRGAFAGAALGFLGAQTAVTSERTSLLLMGVGAALGALWGGLQPAEDRGLQIRVEPMRWEPAEMLRYDPREREP